MRPNNRPVCKTHQISEDQKVIHNSAMGYEPLISGFLEKVMIVSLDLGLIFLQILYRDGILERHF
jgi:hypothetical protein